MAKKYLRHAPVQTGSLCSGVGENVLSSFPGSTCTFVHVKTKADIARSILKGERHLSSIVPCKHVLCFVASLIQKSRGSLGQ